MKLLIRVLLSAFLATGIFSASLGQSNNTLVQFRTVFGDLQVELFDLEKPITVSNFLRYVNSGRYTNMFFHRFVSGFVIQGGGFNVSKPNTPEVNFVDVESFGQIKNEYNVGPKRSNLYGTIAMAKIGGNPDSASSQWFFNFADNSANLDNQNGGFTVFGQVLPGSTNVLNILTNFVNPRFRTTPTNVIIGISGSDVFGDVFSSVPVAKWISGRPGTFADLVTGLVYVDITTHQVLVEALPGNSRRIKWKGVPTVTNRVEYTSTMPPAWQTLTNVVPTDLNSLVIDNSPSATNRFYRVVVDY